jgi:Zn-dependent metalloprotease
MGNTIVPPYLLLRIARLKDPRFAAAADAARRSALHDLPFRSTRERLTAAMPAGAVKPSGLLRTIFDGGNSEALPGREVRSEGEAATGDAAVNEAYDGLGSTDALFRSEYARAGVDGENLPLLATVHYGNGYDNAFWDGSRLVFGDGDGQIFNRFTASLSVIGHELSHGVTQYTGKLAYRGQSGALNESISDVFGALVEQHAGNQTADTASWLIGEGLFTDQVEGRALRSMSAPGTAYDDDVLGKDPQPATMDGYVDTADDNGGVHLNSGIPNRAFFLAASAIGGHAWERAGRIWYDTITGGRLPADSDFAGFASAATDAAGTRYGAGSVEKRAVADAWHEVGVTP